MTSNMRRTAQGKTVDIGALALRNERTRAVGNMAVNARGDQVDADNKPIKSRSKQVKSQYQRQISNVSHDPVQVTGSRDIPAPPEDFDNDFDRTKIENFVKPAPKPTAPISNQKRSGGLAGAVSRTKKG